MSIEFGPRHAKATWDDAWMYCLTLDYDGHKDWRMPTASETIFEIISEVEVWVVENERYILDYPTATFSCYPVRDNDD